MNNLKKMFLTISITLIVLLLSRYGVIYSQPRSGDWRVPTDFGEFVFTVNADGSQITKFIITFSDWTCGGVKQSGTITITRFPAWPISNGQFTLETSIGPSGNVKITINGAFNQAGDEASGIWSAVVYGTTCSGNWEVTFVYVEELPDWIPKRFKIAQNYPNPFNPTTTIEYQIVRECYVSLKVFNNMSQLVKTLVDQKQSAGNYTISWHGTDNTGRQVSSGIYFYIFKTNYFNEAKKMIILR